MAARTVDVENVGPSFARLYGVIDATALSTDVKFTPPTDTTRAQRVDAYITRMPFFIGRTLDDEKDMTADNSLIVSSNKVSRLHASIDYDLAEKQFVLKCFSKNGVDVNEKHVEENERVPLPSKARVRIGPLFVYFLQPRSDAPATATAARVYRSRPAMPYKSMLEALCTKHFAKDGFFCIADVVTLAYKEYAGAGITDNEESARRSFTHVVKRETASYAPVPMSEVPPHLIGDMFGVPRARRLQGWYRILGHAGAAAYAHSRAAVQSSEVDMAEGEGEGESEAPVEE